ncbi:sensor with HAMP domain protein [Paenibacillus yonginensis]|uniref:histidine kinase n=1 Tax=Paenibacillus yonginensis TaxID=1462996 RepID=A0A1B1N6G2_9BACL|nr:sensor histidine kinase [Paenibacillus yonginensis]ANS77020.1 sensor with HAMP domain protein [Paenibacillus yonginensis]
MYKKTSFLLRRLSIKNRLLTAFLITSLLPVAIVAFYSNQIYEASITDKISAYSSQTLTELTRNISRELGQYETLSENIIINDSIQYGLTRYSSLSDFDKNTLQTRIRNELGPQFFSFSNLSNIVIMTNDGETFFDLGYQWYPDNQLSSMVQQTEGAPRNAYWSYLRSNRGSTVIALSRKIYSAENLNLQIGYLVIAMDEKVFARNMFQSVDLGKDSSVYITDRSGVTLSSSSSSLPQGSLNQADLTRRIEAQHEAGRLESFQTKIWSKQYLVSSTFIDAANWYLIGLIPHSYIISELGDLRGNIVLLCLLTLILSSVIGLWIYDSINSPLRSLLRYAKRIHKGRFDPIPKPVAPPDEMQQLTITIHDMVTELKLLIRQVQLEQQAKRDAELKMLQAQINPHFLFNTLNSLKWSAMLSGNESLTQGIGSLSELLRNTILDREELIPLSKEMANLRHYANIQRIRYGDSFELECQPVEPDEDVIVPKFILQPIVENSILHGAANHKRIHICVSFAFRHGHLILTLSDDGKGFDPAELEHKDHAGSRLSGIGIHNVHERIQLHYGAAYGLRTESAPGQGTTTVLTLPLHYVQEEDKAYV